MSAKQTRPAPETHFTGFSPAGLRFLRDLAKHNDRDWFAPKKSIYETELLEPLRLLVADATTAMRRAKIPLGANPRGSVFRIYRDVRFSADKSPYKTNLGAYLSHNGSDDAPGGLYVHVQPRQSFAAVGFYQVEKPLLHRWRAAMASDPKRFGSVLRALERNGVSISQSHDALKRMPRGFEEHADSPIAEYFRRGSFMTSEMLPDAELGSPRLVDHLVALAKRSRPLLDYGWALA